MRIAIDTNRYRDFMENQTETVSTFQQAEQIFLPLPVLAELRSGFAFGTNSLENERILSTFMRRPRVHMLLPDEQSTQYYAQLYVQLRTQGTPIPTNDLWIAALVVQHNLLLCSRDRHFDHLPQLIKI